MTARAAYGSQYRRIRQLMLDPPVLCAHCKQARATTLDHDPPLAMHVHRQGSGCCRYIPSCEECNRTGGALVRHGLWRPGLSPAGTELEEPEPERDGLDAADPVWRVPWLRSLRKVPEDAVWPRLMSVPHRRATGSLGPQFIAWAQRRSGHPLRWWQRLVATRLLEVDADARLVWDALVLSMARQLGKSWLLRELALWRIHQGERFGEPQHVLHTGKDLNICDEIQREARNWAKGRPDVYRVREANGQEKIELIEDGSRWMIRAKEAVYGYSVSLGIADEAWKVTSEQIEEGLTPTMIERNQSQLLLISTAHRLSESLMLNRRALALEQLEAGDGDLLIEWSAPAAAELDDVRTWRLASPHWTQRRERDITRKLEAARAGTLRSEDEPDPIASFTAQWLNIWPRKLSDSSGRSEPLLPAGLWAELCEPGLQSEGPVWVAVEDDYGLGAAVAAAARAGGRLELDGLLFQDWDSALVWVGLLGESRTIRGLQVGASLLDRVPRGLKATPAGGKETRAGLALLRELALAGELVHDETTRDLDDAMASARVSERPTGLHQIPSGATHLIKAAVWALAAAHRPAPVPAIH